MALPLAAALAAASGSATAEAPAALEAGQLAVVNGSFSPRKLPRSGNPAPVALHLSARSPSTSPSPGLREVLLRLDRNVTLETAGLPTCPEDVEGPPPPQRCGSALVGKGKVEVEDAFPEQPPFTIESTLWAFSQGAGREEARLVLYAHLPVPVSAGFAATAEIRRVGTGRYGTEWAIAFPKIAGGYGSIRRLELTFERRYERRGEATSFLLARCPDGHLDIGATAVFSDGSRQEESLARSCSPRR